MENERLMLSSFNPNEPFATLSSVVQTTRANNSSEAAKQDHVKETTEVRNANISCEQQRNHASDRPESEQDHVGTETDASEVSFSHEKTTQNPNENQNSTESKICEGIDQDVKLSSPPPTKRAKTDETSVSLINLGF